MHPVGFVGGAAKFSGNGNGSELVSYMDEDLEARRQRLADLLDHSAELTQRTNEMLAEPRAEVTWTPLRQIKAHDADRIEHELNRRLNTIAAGLNDRMDALEARIQTTWQGLEVLADEGGTATGELEKRLREAIKKEADALRGEVTLLRSEKAGAPQGRKAISRAPWKDVDGSRATN
jgi:hypothetical protein